MGLTEEVKQIRQLKLEATELTKNRILVFPNSGIYEKIRSQLDQSVLRTMGLNSFESKQKNFLQDTNNHKAIVVDDPPISLCAGVEPAGVLSSLQDKFTADEVLAAAKWVCLETALGENTASTCTPLSVAVALYDAPFELGSYCLLNQNQAVTNNTFSTMNNISTDINEFIDTKFSDLNSQDALDSTQASTDEINNSLDSNLPVFQADLNSVLNQLNGANNQLNTIFAQAESLLSRVQFNQVDVENLALTTSDVNQRAQEIRQDTQRLKSRAAGLINQITSLNQQAQIMLKASMSQQIEFNLARSVSLAPLSYQLPFTLGGQLELVREKLINHIITVESLNGETTAVRKLLRTGDQAFNSGQYKLAYNNFSSAYKALLEVSF